MQSGVCPSGSKQKQFQNKHFSRPAYPMQNRHAFGIHHKTGHLRDPSRDSLVTFHAQSSQNVTLQWSWARPPVVTRYFSSFALMNCREKQQFGILAFRCHRKMGHLSELAHGVPREASIMLHSQSRALVRKQPWWLSIQFDCSSCWRCKLTLEAKLCSVDHLIWQLEG